MHVLSLLLYKHAFRFFFFFLTGLQNAINRIHQWSPPASTPLSPQLGWLLFSITAISFTSLFMFFGCRRWHCQPRFFWFAVPKTASRTTTAMAIALVNTDSWLYLICSPAFQLCLLSSLLVIVMLTPPSYYHHHKYMKYF